MIGSADAVARLGLDNTMFQRGLDQAKGAAESFAGSMQKTMRNLGGAIAGAFTFNSLIAGLNQSVIRADQLNDIANRFGVSAESLQKIGNAAQLSGGSVEAVATAFNKLAQNAGKAVGGDEKIAAAFERIGVSLADLRSLSPEQLFLQLSKAVSSGALGTQDFSTAMELAGRQAGVLMETLRMGPEAIQANGEAMGVWSNETIAALGKAADSIATLQNNLTIGFGEIAKYGNQLGDVFNMVAEAAAMAGLAVKEAFSGNLQGARDLLKAASDTPSRYGSEQDRLNRQRAAAQALSRGDMDAAGSSLGPLSASRQRLEDELRQLDEKEMLTDERIAMRALIRDAEKNRDRTKAQQAYLQQQTVAANTLSARRDAQTRAFFSGVGAMETAQAARRNAEEDIAAGTLTASRRGNQILDFARRAQAESNRQDNFKFGEEMVQKYVDRMRTRGSGQTFEQFQKYSKLADDAARNAARKDLAAKAARGEAPSMRDSAQDTLKNIEKLLEENLEQLRTYAHAA